MNLDSVYLQRVIVAVFSRHFIKCGEDLELRSPTEGISLSGNWEIRVSDVCKFARSVRSA